MWPLPTRTRLEATVDMYAAQVAEVRRILDQAVVTDGMAADGLKADPDDVAQRLADLLDWCRVEREVLTAQVSGLQSLVAAGQQLPTTPTQMQVQQLRRSLYDLEDQLEFCRRHHGSNGRLHRGYDRTPPADGDPDPVGDRAGAAT